MRNRNGIVNAAVDMLTTGTGKALLLTGPWGCGKTFLWRQEIEPKIRAKKPNAKVIYLSCFGVESIGALKSQLFTKFLIESTFKGKNISSKMIELGGAALKFLPELSKKFAGLNIIPSNIDTMQFVAGEIVLCIDDVERKDDKLSIESILGFVNLLTEQKQMDVLIITNDDKIQKNDLEKYKAIKEKTVSKSITIHADIETSFDLFLKNPEFSDDVRNHIKEKRIVIADLFIRAKEHNLRSLQRVLADLALIKKNGITLADEHVATLSSFILEHANGSLEDKEFYTFNMLSFEMKKMRKHGGSDLSDTEKKQEAFFARYFSASLKFKNSETIYDFVQDGHVDFQEISRELFPPEAQLSDVDKFILSMKDFGFFHQSEQQMRSDLVQMEKYINEEKTLYARQIIDLAIYSKHGLELLGETISQTLNDKIKEKLKNTANAGDDSFSSLVRMHYGGGFQNYWNEYVTPYEAILNPKLEQKDVESMKAVVDSADYRTFYYAINLKPLALALFIDQFLNEDFFRNARDKGNWYYLVVETVIEEIQKYNISIIPNIDVLTAKVKNHLDVVAALDDIDKMDRYRNGLLQQKF